MEECEVTSDEEKQRVRRFSTSPSGKALARRQLPQSRTTDRPPRNRKFAHKRPNRPSAATTLKNHPYSNHITPSHPQNTAKMPAQYENISQDLIWEVVRTSLACLSSSCGGLCSEDAC